MYLKMISALIIFISFPIHCSESPTSEGLLARLFSPFFISRTQKLAQDLYHQQFENPVKISANQRNFQQLDWQTRKFCRDTYLKNQDQLKEMRENSILKAHPNPDHDQFKKAIEEEQTKAINDVKIFFGMQKLLETAEGITLSNSSKRKNLSGRKYSGIGNTQFKPGFLKSERAFLKKIREAGDTFTQRTLKKYPNLFAGYLINEFRIEYKDLIKQELQKTLT